MWYLKGFNYLASLQLGHSVERSQSQHPIIETTIAIKRKAGNYRRQIPPSGKSRVFASVSYPCCHLANHLKCTLFFSSPIPGHYVHTWREPQNRKYISYRNAAKEERATAMTRIENLVKLRRVNPEAHVCVQRDRRTQTPKFWPPY